jgi:methylated-DNA-[protein]-cysteine S-methyltransferase
MSEPGASTRPSMPTDTAMPRDKAIPSDSIQPRDDLMTTPFLPADPAGPAGYDIVDSAVGRILLTGDESALSGLYLLDAGEHSAAVRPGWTRRPGGFGPAARQLAEYFDGSRRDFDLSLAPLGTPFQLAVWAELTRIPYGVTVSYGEVAAALGKSPVASRAVGLANGRNPIGADGSMTGYGWGVERKEWLLRHEGAGAVRPPRHLQDTLFG